MAKRKAMPDPSIRATAQWLRLRYLTLKYLNREYGAPCPDWCRQCLRCEIYDAWNRFHRIIDSDHGPAIVGPKRSRFPVTLPQTWGTVRCDVQQWDVAKPKAKKAKPRVRQK